MNHKFTTIIALVVTVIVGAGCSDEVRDAAIDGAVEASGEILKAAACAAIDAFFATDK